MAIAIIIGWVIRPDGLKIRENTEIINLNKDLLQTKKDLRDSLLNQVEYIESVNDAFDKATEIDRPRNDISHNTNTKTSHVPSR